MLAPGSLHHRHNLTLVSNVCEAALISWFWASNRLNKLPEVHFEFPFILIDKSTVASLTGQSWRVLKSWYTGGPHNNDFRAVLQMNLTRVQFRL